MMKIEEFKADEAKIKQALLDGKLIPFEKIWKEIPIKERREIEEEVLKDIMAQKLREMRKKKKISQELVAKKSGLKREAISRIESGKHNPTIRTLGRIANALDKELVIEFQDVKAGS